MLHLFVFNTIGFVGDFITLWAYFLLHIGKLKAGQLSYALYNAIGSVCLLISLWYQTNLPAVFIEVSWLAISLYGIGMYIYNVKKLRKCALERAHVD